MREAGITCRDGWCHPLSGYWLFPSLLRPFSLHSYTQLCPLYKCLCSWLVGTKYYSQIYLESPGFFWSIVVFSYVLWVFRFPQSFLSSFWSWLLSIFKNSSKFMIRYCHSFFVSLPVSIFRKQFFNHCVTFWVGRR